MAMQRELGEVQPGFKWGPFMFRVPFLHTRMEWPEFLQGIFVAGATGLGLVPILTLEKFGFMLTFEEAVACIFIQSVLISSAPILFGEPYSPGWITPALPLVLMFIAGLDADATPIDRFQTMTALSLWFAAIVFFLGITGLGKVFIENIPAALKAGIILGAAIAALKEVFVDKAPEFLLAQPWTTISAVSICLLLTFSIPIQRMKLKYKPLAIFAGLGLLPGFIIAGIIGPIMGEVTYEIPMDQLIIIPPFMDMLHKVSPFFIGFPGLDMLLNPNIIFLALMGYVILFGDLITGTEVLQANMKKRPDEHIDININRSHFSIAIRNVLMALFAPFFPTQGCLWTGVHVIVVQRWTEGRKGMDSLFSGISSYYVFGIPLLYLVVPLLYALKPLMGVALSLTLVLTGFACAYVAMGITRTQIERGVALLTAVTLALFAEQPWLGMVVGVIATILLIGPNGGPEKTGE
jgi:hypothetical protein